LQLLIHPTKQRRKNNSTQMGVDWVIAEYDKSKLVDASLCNGPGEAMENISSDFEFDDARFCKCGRDAESAVLEIDDAPSNFYKKCWRRLQHAASDHRFEPFEHTYRVRFRVVSFEKLRLLHIHQRKLAARIKVI
jgi:type IV pilus assembly protein PilB